MAPVSAPVGVASILGIAGAVAGAAGAVVAGINDKSPEAIGAGIAGVLLALSTQGGRYAQAIAQIRQGVDAADRQLDELDDPHRDLSEVPVPIRETAPTPSINAHAVGARGESA